ncbi:hypothetical protein [Cohnella lupini]|nr:hypothetical protein [Cohnella lupini]
MKKTNLPNNPSRPGYLSQYWGNRANGRNQRSWQGFGKLTNFQPLV